MKLDKETMIKQRFWFLLPVFAICVLVAWICVLGVRGETDVNYKAAKDKDTTLKSIASAQELKNQKWIDEMTKELEVSTAKKNELWVQEFDRQNRVVRDPKDKTKFRRLEPYFFTWPDQTRSQWEKTSQGRKLDDMDFGEPLGNLPSDEYRKEYLGQFEYVVDTIRDWLDESNGTNLNGAVRVINGSGNHRRNVISQLLTPFALNNDKHVLSDEIYLLQEDLAVKREIFTSLADLLDSYSRLKNEWYETPFVDIVVAPPQAPVVAAPPAAGDGAVVPAAPVPPATPEPVKKDQEPEVYQKYRFYNYIWPNMLNAQDMAQDAKLKGVLTDYGLPVIDPYKGWRIDLSVTQDPQDEKKLLLRGVSANHGNTLTLPVQPLLVWYNELNSDKETTTPLLISDAGGVGPSEYWPNASLKKMSQKNLKDIPLPDKFGRITRITRVLPENTLDQQIVFNNDWAVHVQLIRRPNTPNLYLRGEILNRSGRRIPVSTFTAGLTLPNDTKLLFEDFKVATDAFNAGERRNFSLEIKNPIQPKSISLVKQKLTWRSTPIKRIDRLVLGSDAHMHSDRLKTLPLKPYDFKRKDPLNQNTTTTALASAEGSGSNKEFSTGGGSIMGGGIGGGGGGGADAAALSPNQGIPLNRYVEVSSQLRRMPVALVMVVDATAITDIIGAMSNSRLRFQVTLAPWTKVPNLGKPGGMTVAEGPTGGGDASGTAGAGAGGGKFRSGGVTGGGSLMGGGSGTGAAPGQGSTGTPPPPGGGAAGTPRPSGTIGLEDDSSVVELQIYGIVTIYESPDHFKRIEALRANPPATPAAGTTPTAPGK